MKDLYFSIDQINNYLKKLCQKRRPPDLSFLKSLQKHHILKFPLENLDFHYGKDRKWDLNLIFNKTVLGNRGGLGFELNFLFKTLLVDLGFKALCVRTKAKINGHYRNHSAIVVFIEKKMWLVDVGLFMGIIEPKKIITEIKQLDYSQIFMFGRDIDEWWSLKKYQAQDQITIYQFQLKECMMIEFLMDYNIEKKLNNKFVAKYYPEGWCLLNEHYFNDYRNGETSTTPILNEDDFLSKTKELTGISLLDLIQ